MSILIWTVFSGERCDPWASCFYLTYRSIHNKMKYVHVQVSMKVKQISLSIKRTYLLLQRKICYGEHEIMPMQECTKRPRTTPLPRVTDSSLYMHSETERAAQVEVQDVERPVGRGSHGLLHQGVSGSCGYFPLLWIFSTLRKFLLFKMNIICIIHSWKPGLGDSLKNAVHSE